MPAITDLPIWTTEGYEIRTQGVTDTTPATYTYAGTMGNYVFRNDGGVNLTLTINGSAVTVATGQMVTGNTFSSFTVQASSGSVSWTMRAFQESPMNISQSASSNMSPLLTFQIGATAIGNGTAVDVSGYATLSLDVVISATATVIFEGSLDGTNYTQIVCVFPGTGSAVLTTATSTFRDVRFNVSAIKFFRARISAYTSGTVDVTGYLSTASLVQILPMSAYGNNDTNSAAGAIVGVGAYNLLFDGTNWARQRSATGIGDGTNNGSIASVALTAFNGTNWDRVRSVNTGQLKTTLYNSSGSELGFVTAGSLSDGAALTNQGIVVANINYGWNGSTFDRVRVGKVYKYIEFLNLANATATTVWTPAAGKKFRLMGVKVSTSAAANVHLRDGTAGSGTKFDTYRMAGADSKTFDFGNGYLSSAANNVLEVYNDTGSAVSVWVTAWGTEE